MYCMCRSPALLSAVRADICRSPISTGGGLSANPGLKTKLPCSAVPSFVVTAKLPSRRSAERIAFGYLVSQKFTGECATLEVLRNSLPFDPAIAAGTAVMIAANAFTRVFYELESGEVVYLASRCPVPGRCCGKARR